MHEAVQDVRQEVNNTGEMLAEKIDVQKLRSQMRLKSFVSDLKDDLKSG